MEYDKMNLQVQIDGAYEGIVALNETLDEITQQLEIQGDRDLVGL